MKWVLIIPGVIVALVLVLSVVGILLPKGHVAAKRVRLKQAPADVWSVIIAYAEQPTWRPDLVKVERLADQNGHEVWNEVAKNGESMPLETLEAVAPTRLVRKIANPKLPFGGTWTYEIEPAKEGCMVTITERGEVYNPIFRVFSRLMDMSATIDRYLQSLAKKLGEEPALEPVAPE